MKLANLAGRAVVVTDTGAVDVERASSGRFGSDVQALYERWAELRAWVDGADPVPGTAALPAARPFDEAGLRSPAPRPRQVFGIGINYREHAAETGKAVPSVPAIFTKFPSSLAGPFDPVRAVNDTVDWEVELVVVVGARADDVAEADGWDHVAGVTVGQDISDRTLQRAAGAQFSLGKSHRGFGPMGPWLVTPDDLPDRDDLALGCSVDGEVVQDGRTSDLVVTVPQLIALLSSVVTLLPGDVIFTGTPPGVGVARQPPRFLRPGQVLESWIEGVGRMRNPIAAP